jgi:hypothetical protein
LQREKCGRAGGSLALQQGTATASHRLRLPVQHWEGPGMNRFDGNAAMHYRPNNIGKHAPINWRRGMIRLWILASVAWIMAWIIYFAIEMNNSRLDAVASMLVLFAPPIALLLFGLATRWAFRGFEVEDQYPRA